MSFLSRCCSNCIAFCIRHSVTYSSGVCPSCSLKRAANAERDMPAAPARDSTVQGKRDVLAYFANPPADVVQGEPAQLWAQVQADLIVLATMPTSNEPEPYP